MSYCNLKTNEPNLFKLYTVIDCVVLKVCIVFGEIPNFHVLQNVKELKQEALKEPISLTWNPMRLKGSHFFIEIRQR